MSFPAMLFVDLAAVLILAFPLYYRRHGRRDLAAAFVVLNVSVLSVAAILGSIEVGLGVGMGLFGVLSIIRLRSSQISHIEIAYYFSSLAIGLVAGLPVTDHALSISLVALILAAVTLADSCHLLGAWHSQHVRVAGALTSDTQAKVAVEALLGHRVRSARVIDVNFNKGQTTVDVRWKRSDAERAATNAPATSPIERNEATPDDQTTQSVEREARALGSISTAKLEFCDGHA